MYGTRPYHIWNQMRNRCSPKYSQRKYYYNKGIKVCDEWLDFVVFWSDMKKNYEPTLTIDRIDNSKGYFKENCRWVSAAEQCVNKTTNRLIAFQGLTKPLIVWTKELGLPYERTRKRLNRGWTFEKAIR